MIRLSGEQAHTISLVYNLTRREVSAQYKRTALGRLWSLINPLATIGIYTLIFGVVMDLGATEGRYSGLHSFAVWIAAGVLCWGFMSGAIIGAMNSMVMNSALLTKVYFPRYVLVISAVLSQVFNHVWELLALTAVVLVVGGPGILPVLPAVALLVLLAGVFATGIGLILSVTTVYFRDISHLWSIFNQIWMYASGVIFPISLIEQLQDKINQAGVLVAGRHVPVVGLFRANPAERLLEAYRSVFYDFAWPDWPTLGYLAVWAVAMLMVGSLVFNRLSPRIVEEL